MNRKMKIAFAKSILLFVAVLITMAFTGLFIKQAHAQTSQDIYRVPATKLRGFHGNKPESQIASERYQAMAEGRPQEQSWQFRAAIEQNLQWQRRDESVAPQPQGSRIAICRPTVQQQDRSQQPKWVQQSVENELCIKEGYPGTGLFILFEPLDAVAGSNGDKLDMTFKYYLKDGTTIYKRYPVKLNKFEGVEESSFSIDGIYSAKDVIRTMNESVALTYFYTNLRGATIAVDILLPAKRTGLFILERN